jgi:photosystem II stability/assembly factor-like uncharacterized protein
MDADFESTASRAHVRRASALIAVSLVVILCAGILYVSPSLPSLFQKPGEVGAKTQSTFRIGAVDFVDPLTGWVTAELGGGNVAMLHTTDGGATWTRQLTVAADVHPLYMNFFDGRVGVIALLGVRPNLFRTEDGGQSWTNLPALTPQATVMSWSFVNDTYGWLLARTTDSAKASTLYRTSDGGRTWDNLGVPVRPPAQAYQVHFSYVTTGWLTTSGPSPVAYKSEDFGATWRPVPLPPGCRPPCTWPSTGQFFVGVQPTSGMGAIASVVWFPPIKGRTGVGGTIRSFPPLTVRAFDGGRPYTYLYTTVLDRLTAGAPWGSSPPNETILSTVDNGASWSLAQGLPDGGALGYFAAHDWWWIGGRELRTSGDGGVTWGGSRLVDAVDPSPGLLQVLDGSHAWLAGVQDGGPILQRTDDGLHWRTVSLPSTP